MSQISAYTREFPEVSNSAQQASAQCQRLIDDAAFKAAHVERLRRGSTVLSDSDMRKGYERVLSSDDAGVLRRIGGQFTMVVGTVVISFWPVNPGFAFVGAFICCLGIVMREYRGK